MTWKDEIELEFARARDAERNGNQGRARTSARRAAGIAITELQKRYPEKQYGRDFVTQLRTFAVDASIPAHVRDAAHRLQARISPSFGSPSTLPVEDAGIIVLFVSQRLA